MRFSKIIDFLTIVVALAAIVYFSFYFADDAVKFYNNFQDLKKTEIGSVISKVSRQILTSSPLKIGGQENQVVLLRSKVIAETNLQRQKNGLPSLEENLKLNDAAFAKANDMFKNQYFEHVSPTGTDPGELVQNFGYDYIVTGENLILGNFSNEEEVVQDWMNSPGHRANILNSRYSEIGVTMVKGIYEGRSVWIGVQEFGLPLSSCSEPNDALKDEINFKNIQLDAISSQINEKKTQIDNTNKRTPAYRQMVEDYNQLVAQYNLLAEETKQNIIIYNNQVNNFNACVSGT